MLLNTLELFAIATVVNVIFSTMRSVFTIKGTPLTASLMNALAYGFYPLVIILTNADDITLVEKMGITALANFIGVYIVKFGEKKFTKDKLWKIDFTIYTDVAETIISLLKKKDIPYCYNEYGKHTMFSAFCQTQAESVLVANIVKDFNGKYFVSENRSLF